MTSYIDTNDETIEELAGSLFVTKGKIITWLKQFEEQHQPIALSLLKSIRFYDITQINAACRKLLETVTAECGGSIDNVCFMGLGSAGKSGGTILHRFRHANDLGGKKHDRKFKFSSEITSLPKEFNGTIVFLDDFVGSGTQAAVSLTQIISIAPSNAKIILCVIAGYESALRNIGREVECKVLPFHIIEDRERLFSDDNPAFSREEKDILRAYCRSTGSKSPYGFRDISSLVIFQDGPPNNTPSILTHTRGSWKPLFPRV